MSRFSKIIFAAAVMFAAASCAHVAKIEGEVQQAASSEVIVKLLNINKFDVLDTVSVDPSGKFEYSVEVEEGNPEFIYVFYKDRKIASMILSDGDRVSFQADTLGNFTVTGSEESEKLAQVEKDFAAVTSRLDALSARLESASEQEVAAIRKGIADEYIAYYRDRVRYVMQNPYSLTVVPVLYQVLGDNLPVFSQFTDAIHFSNACDSLEVVYPASKYVSLLRKEAEARKSQMELSARLGSADEIGFMDIALPDMNGEKQVLSSVDSKVILVHFWTATEPSQKMLNLDILKPLYEEFHDKGFEIYQVAIDPDKGAWANVMKEQKLPWINVCDIRGGNSPYAMIYNIEALPAAFIIKDGELVDGGVIDAKSLRKLVAGQLR